jgi:hypothetical protein
MNKYIEIIKLLERIFGKSAVSKSLGTRTNVVRLPGGKQGLDPTTRHFDVEGTAQKNPELVNTIKNSIEDRMGDITKMNDQELLTYKQNLQRLADHVDPPVLPSADIISAGSKQRVTGEGLERLIRERGIKNPPTTTAGQLESTSKRLQKLQEDFSKEFDVENIAKQEADRQAMIARQYEGKGYAGGVFGPSGMYRAVARDFLLDQHAKGKIKLSPDTIKNLEERNYISGGQPLMYADPIRVLRYHYGDDVFEKIPLDKIPTGAKSEIIDVMSKVEAPPIKTEAPKNPGGYLTPGEYKANIEEMQKIEEMIKRRESRFANMSKEEIQNELEQYGSKRSTFEMGFEQDYPDEFAKYKGPKEPEEKADGGPIGLDYLMGMDNRPKYAGGGNVKKILDLIAKANKELKGKKSMEEAMTVAKKRGDEMRAMGLDPAKSKDYDEYIKIKETSGDKDFNKYFDDLEIKTKFKGVISDDLLNQILIDDNPQRKAEVIATIEQGLTMQEKGMSPEQIVDILKNTTRTKQADGGPIGLNYLLGI